MLKLSSVQINLADGSLIDINTIQKDGDLEFDNHLHHTKISTVFDEDSAIFSVCSELKPASPLFKKQNYFSPSQAINLRFASEKGDRPISETTCTDSSAQRAYLAVYQHKEWWLRPVQFTGEENIPERTQLLLWQEGDLFYIMMSLCGSQYRSDLSGSKKGIQVKLSSNCNGLNRCAESAFILCKGKDPYLCLETASKKLIQAAKAPVRHRSEKAFPEKFKKLGWCSWDAFYKEVSAKGIFEKLDELKEKKIPVDWVLIDDGWSDADYKRLELKGLSVAEERFPEGLAKTIEKIKTEYQVSYVGVWQAIMGYWNGLAQDHVSNVLKPYLKTLPDGRQIPSFEAHECFGFWNHWHRFLKEQGVDFVKVDSQSAVSIFYSGQKTFGEASRGVQQGLEASVSLHFDNNIIHCMGMAPEEIWNRPNAALSRSSDDFVPEVKDGFREHALQNGFNSLLHGQFYWGDWDMFWSNHRMALDDEQKTIVDISRQNSFLRAVSGGPVYTSDKVAQTDPKYLLPLISKDGTVLRCEEVGLPTLDCLLQFTVLKLFNRYRDCTMVAAFSFEDENEKNPPCRLTLGDIPALKEDQYWLYDWCAKEGSVLSREDAYAFTLSSNDVALFLLLPAKHFCPLGLIGKYLSPATIEKAELYGDKAYIWLIQGGCFGFFSELPPKSFTVNGKETPWEQKGKLYLVDCETEEKPFIAICF